MDKISRLLLLYYKLSQGEKVNKISFCLETGCHPRSFDRDIEDIRLFLADTYIYDNLEYKRIEKIYQFTGNNRQRLDKAEYFLIKRLVIDSNILRTDELFSLLRNVKANTVPIYEDEDLKKEVEEKTAIINKAVMKLYNDLLTMIHLKRSVIIKYCDLSNKYKELEVIPYRLKYESGAIVLTAFGSDEFKGIPFKIRLNQIESLTGARNLTHDECKMLKDLKNDVSNVEDQRVVLKIRCQDITLLKSAPFLAYDIIDTDDSSVTIKAEVNKYIFFGWLSLQDHNKLELLEPKSVIDEMCKYTDRLNKQWR